MIADARYLCGSWASGSSIRASMTLHVSCVSADRHRLDGLSRVPCMIHQQAARGRLIARPRQFTITTGCRCDGGEWRFSEIQQFIAVQRVVRGLTAGNPLWWDLAHCLQSSRHVSSFVWPPMWLTDCVVFHADRFKKTVNFTFSSESRYKKINDCKYTCIYVNIFV